MSATTDVARKALLKGSWRSMVNRCYNSHTEEYKNYGGRGITVCSRWRESFENFLADMGERPEGMTLDRADNNGNYEPGNCRWATVTEQAHNRRNNRFLTANGETMTMAEWARRLGCNPAAILARLSTGMDEAEAVTKPIPKRPNSKLSDEKVREIRNIYPALSLQKLADRFLVSKKTVLNVLHGRVFADLI